MRKLVDWARFDRPEDAEEKYTNSLAPDGDKYDQFKHLLHAHHNETFNHIDKTKVRVLKEH